MELIFERYTKKAYVFRINIKDSEKAMTYSKMAIEVNPKSANVHHIYGLIQFELGEKKKACDFFQKFLEMEKDIKEKCMN